MMLTMISVHWDQTTDRRPFTPVFLFPAVPMILANTSPLPLITFYITFLSLFFSLFSVSLKVVFLFPDACQNLSLFCLFSVYFFSSRCSATCVPSFIILLFFLFLWHFTNFSHSCLVNVTCQVIWCIFLLPIWPQNDIWVLFILTNLAQIWPQYDISVIHFDSGGAGWLQMWKLLLNDRNKRGIWTRAPELCVDQTTHCRLQEETVVNV